MQPASSLDIEDPVALIEYLRTRGVVGADDQPSIEILKGGVSNRVVRVLKPTGEAWVIKQALPKLRVAVDWYASPDRIHREALGLRWLKALGLAVPELRFEDPDHHLLAMDAVPEPHVNWKSDRDARGHACRFLQPAG